MIAELLSDSVTQFISSIGYAGIFLLMALESAAIPVPSELIMTFSGYLAYQGVFDFTSIVILGAAGCMAGSMVSYWIGLKGGRVFIDKYGKYFFMNHHHLDIAELWFKKYGDKAVLFSRMLPVVRTFISLPAGMGRYDFKKLIIFSFIGSLPWCFALAYIGLKLGPQWKNIITFFNGLDMVIVFVLIALIVYYRKNKK
jgi:membrane protein DedA with SNARE-associated domain